jgi:Telomerase ribonucleoprotein complex - RNA binding domain
MLQTIRENHARLSCLQLLNHHCPIPGVISESNSGVGLEQSPTQLSAQPAQVYLFVKSVLLHLVGPQQLGFDNWQIFLRRLRQFFNLRRFENQSLGNVIEGIKVCFDLVPCLN